MTHLDDDALLGFVLETLDAPEESRVREHVIGCPECCERMGKVQADVDRLSGVSLQVREAPVPPLPVGRRFLPVLTRVAAILAVGFLAGYVTADLSAPVHPEAVQQRLVPGVPAAPRTGYFPCRPVDVGPGAGSAAGLR
jgi:anti-sigma factor RsiW